MTDEAAIRAAVRGCMMILALASFMLGGVWVMAACIPGVSPPPDAATQARWFFSGLGCLILSIVAGGFAVGGERRDG